MEKHVNKRGFTKELIESLKNSIKWDLHDRDLDSQSLDVFKGLNLSTTKINLK